jgi:hypothetical protein
MIEILVWAVAILAIAFVAFVGFIVLCTDIPDKHKIKVGRRKTVRVTGTQYLTGGPLNVNVRATGDIDPHELRDRVLAELSRYKV